MTHDELERALTLVTYARLLIARCAGSATTPAALYLWRQLAGNHKGFELEVASTLEAQDQLALALGAPGT